MENVRLCKKLRPEGFLQACGFLNCETKTSIEGVCGKKPQVTFDLILNSPCS